MKENLKDILYSRHMNVNQLAMKCEITASVLYNEVNGKQPWFPGHKKKVAKFLNIPEEELFKEA